MEILQLPIMALEERIEQEMEENPILEIQEEDPDLPAADARPRVEERIPSRDFRLGHKANIDVAIPGRAVVTLRIARKRTPAFLITFLL